MYCALMYCALMYCALMYCALMYCALMYCALMYCALMYCALMYCALMYCVLGTSGLFEWICINVLCIRYLNALLDYLSGYISRLHPLLDQECSSAGSDADV